MNRQILKNTIQQFFEGNNGLLAMDESNGTCNKYFAAAEQREYNIALEYETGITIWIELKLTLQ